MVWYDTIYHTIYIIPYHLYHLISYTTGNTDPNTVLSLSVQKAYASIWKTLDKDSEVTTKASIEDAMNFAQNIGAADGMQTLITGSPHLVGGALYYIQRTNSETPTTRATMDQHSKP